MIKTGEIDKDTRLIAEEVGLIFVGRDEEGEDEYLGTAQQWEEFEEKSALAYCSYCEEGPCKCEQINNQVDEYRESQ